GIGRGIAMELARAGANVIITHLPTSADEANAQSAVADIRVLGRDAFAVPMDVTDKDSIASALGRIPAQLDAISTLVNNAGVMQRGAGMDTSDEDFDRCHAVNVRGVWTLTRALVPCFKAQGHGNIINIASGAGRRGSPDLPAYCASKAAVISLSQSLAA